MTCLVAAALAEADAEAALALALAADADAEAAEALVLAALADPLADAAEDELLDVQPARASTPKTRTTAHAEAINDLNFIIPLFPNGYEYGAIVSRILIS